MLRDRCFVPPNQAARRGVGEGRDRLAGRNRWLSDLGDVAMAVQSIGGGVAVGICRGKRRVPGRVVDRAGDYGSQC